MSTDAKQGRAHIDFLDYLRGVAILSVFFYHCLLPSFNSFHPGWTGAFRDMRVGWDFLLVSPAWYGAMGVPIFFAISGFCIHLSHERSRDKSFQVFFIRRFFRIYPPYLVALVFSALFVVAIREDTVREALRQFVVHFVMLQNLDVRFFYGINGAYWSVAVEAQLYLLYPLLIWLAARLGGWQRAIWVPAIIEVALRCFQTYLALTGYPHEPSRLLTGTPFYYWFSWAIGAALADAYLKGEPLPFRSWLGFAWPVLFIGSYFLKPFYPLFFLLAALSTTSLMSFLLSRRASNPHPSGVAKYFLEPLRWAGIVSYSAYLIHIPMLNRIPHVLLVLLPHHTFSPLTLYGICMLSAVPIFALSYVFYRVIEQPSIAWGKRIVEGRRKKPTA